MKYVCDNCGAVIDELSADTEYVGYSHGTKYEYAQEECVCGGSYIEGEQCELCGEWTAPDDLSGSVGRVCKGCLEAGANWINGVKFGDCDEARSYGKVNLNPMLARSFSVKEIEDLLVRELCRIMASCLERDKERIRKAANEWCLGQDTDEFADWLTTNGKEER